MKNLSLVLTTSFGLCAGLALYYICLVQPGRQRLATPTTEAAQQEKSTITVARDGTLYVAGKQVDSTKLTSRLKELNGQQPVTIRADVITKVGCLEEVVRACQAAAIPRISFAPPKVQ